MSIRLACRINVAEDGATHVTVSAYDAAGARVDFAETSYTSPSEAYAALAKTFGAAATCADPPPPAPAPRRKR